MALMVGVAQLVRLSKAETRNRCSVHAPRLSFLPPFVPACCSTLSSTSPSVYSPYLGMLQVSLTPCSATLYEWKERSPIEFKKRERTEASPPPICEATLVFLAFPPPLPFVSQPRAILIGVLGTPRCLVESQYQKCVSLIPTAPSGEE